VFCVECGREVEDDDQLRGGICVDCFLERNPLMVVPEVMDLVRCPSCGATHGKGGWSGPGEVEDDPDRAMEEAAADAAEAEVKVMEGAMVRSMDLMVHREARTVFNVQIDARLGFMGQVVEDQVRTRVRVKGEQCPPCSRLAGQYFEAIIQFRGTADRPASTSELERARSYVLDEVERLSASSRDVGLMKAEEIHGGLDFYITSQPAAAQMARGLATKFGAASTSSSKLTGRRDGKDVVRVTHVVRLPELRRGDFVVLRGTLLRVVSASSKEATVDPAAGTAKRRHLSRGDLRDLELVGDHDCHEEAVVVSTSGSEAQVLDPMTMRTVDVRVPEGYEIEGRETVNVVRVEDQLHIVD
jgi:nonsense-mediated mRNA decay protein 3